MRLDIDSFREIGDALVRNKSRSLLTGFGIFWGLFMLLFLKGGGAGLKRIMTANFEGFATNTAVIYSEKTTMPFKGFRKGRTWYLEDKDLDRLRMMIPELDVVTAVVSNWGQTAINGANTTNCNVKGVPANYCKVEEPQLKYGRYLNETDCLQERKVCVIGKRVYTSLFPQGGDPCGSFVKIGPVYYQVIGVDFSSGNMNLQGSADRAAVVPIQVAKKIYHRGKHVDIIGMTGKSGVSMSALEQRVRQVVAREHVFDPQDKLAMGYINTEEIFQVMDNLFKGINFLILLVGLGTILAGAIGVSNIMMVTVKERTTEIGIRRAIGATPVQILMQIILESVTLTLIAGCAGIMFSVVSLSGLEKIIAASETGPVPFQIDFWTAIVAALLLAVLGVVAGLAPSLRAMKIKPVEAMRDE